MEIQQNNNETRGEFSAFSDGKQAGLMTYSWAGNDKFIIDHTEVDPAFGGKGVGKELVLAAVKFARENDLKVIPLCPFAAAAFKKDTGIQDVLS
ncbi:MAG: N-acetyltransferase [Flavobacteriia bacterium]|nr:N-acetyltransferase [Flavobacteriia bacterium]OJX39714.1 MAG: GNAT family N-acetyltransferase [Flavobacteriia bacterium 40-80]